MASLKELLVKIGADTSGLDKGLDAGSAKIGGFSLGAIGKLAGVTAAVSAIGAAALAIGREWESATATIRVGTGALGADLEDLKESAQDLFADLPTSAANAATAIADLNTRTGLTGPALEALATQVINLSRITGTDLTGGIQTLTRVFGDWSIKATEVADATDFLFRVSQTTGISITQLAGSVVQFGAPLRQLGFDFESAAVLLGRFEQEGVNTTTVMSGLRQAITNLSREGASPAEGLRLVAEAIRDMGEGAEANTLAMRVFGSEAGPDLAAALLEGRFEIDAMVAALKGSSETVNQAAADALTLGDRWTIVKNKATEAAEPIGSTLVGALTAAADETLALQDAMAAGESAAGDYTSNIDATTAALGSLDFALASALGEAQKKSVEKMSKASADLAKEMADAAMKAHGLDDANKDLKGGVDNTKKAYSDLVEKLQRGRTATGEAANAARDATRDYFDLEHAARAASIGVEAFTLRAGESPVKIDGLAEASRKAAAEMQAAHDSGELVAPVIDQVGASALGAVPFVDDLAWSFRNLDVASGLALDATREWQENQLTANQRAMEAAGVFQDVGFEAGELARPGNAKGIPAVSTAITNLGSAIVDTITGGGSILEKAKNIFIDFGKTILQSVVEQALTPLIGKLTELIGLRAGLDALGGTLGGLFGGGGSVATGAVGGGLPSGGGAGGAAGSAAGGAMGAVNMVTGIATAISSIFGNFQNARMETTLNAIEENTRRGTLFLGDRGDGGILGVLFRVLDQVSFGPAVKAAEQSRDYLSTHLGPIDWQTKAIDEKVGEIGPIFRQDLEETRILRDEVRTMREALLAFLERPTILQIDGQEIARAVGAGQEALRATA